MIKTHILGFPRIGGQRELKKTLESYWNGKITQNELLEVAKEIRKTNWQIQSDLDFVTVGDFSLYDHILDLSIMLGVIPNRFEHTPGNEVSIDTMFTLGRGQSPGKKDVLALSMTKWFNTNYHYMVPELTASQEFSISGNKLFREIDEAMALGHTVKPVLVGPLTYLWLSKTKDSEFDKLDLLPKLIAVYNKVLAKLNEKNINYLQIDEPILTLELPLEWQQAFIMTYKKLDFQNIKSILTTYFGDLDTNLEFVSQLPVHGLHIDICQTPSSSLVKIANSWPKNKVFSLGIINGRNIWKNDLAKSLHTLEELHLKFADNLWIATSCSLIHTPVDLDSESELDPQIKNWLAFAKQKIDELSTLATGINLGKSLIQDKLDKNQQQLHSRLTAAIIHKNDIKQKVAAITSDTAKRKSIFAKRIQVQAEKLNLPLFPTTTIGSFPQTSTIRRLRQEYKNGKITLDFYTTQIKQEIKNTITFQENLGIDVLVHGEAERNDMVEYFGELLDGFVFTQNGWVQSYGSRCVKPPIIYGDIRRKSPMTIAWSKYAQSLTRHPVKGMLTGPVTILSWSFVRDDQTAKDTALQIALALRDEVNDLEAAGINIIQIDEPAFREALPLKKRDWQEYLDWAVQAFRISSSGVADSTQIHTHMCYSSFNDVIKAIADLDADVITIETSRGDLELLKAFDNFNYPNQIGPGVYDIHSPRIPEVKEIVHQVEKMLEYIPREKLWINPDCGLKTRNWSEVEKALHNMQAAAQILRAKF